MRMRRVAVSLLLVLVLLGTGGGVSGREIRQGDQCEILADQVIEGNLFVLCRILTINGTVRGNLIGAASSAVLNGAVEGDIYLLAGHLDVNGTVSEDVHFAGPVLRLQGQGALTGGQSDIVSLSLSTTIAERSRVPGSIVGVGYQLVLDGEVGGEVNYWGSALSIGGRVNQDVEAAVAGPDASVISQWLAAVFPLLLGDAYVNPGLVVRAGGVIQGDLRYAGPSAGIIEGLVRGATVYTEVIVQPDLTQIIGEEQAGGRELGVFLSQTLNEFITLAVIGTLGLALLPRVLQMPMRHLQPKRVLPSLGMGLGVFVLSFIVALALIVLSVILLVIVAQLQLNSLSLAGGVVLGVIDAGAIGLFYFVALFVSRAVVGLMIGRWVVSIALGDDGSGRITWISLFVGIGLLAVLAHLPAVGGIISWASALLGLGAVVFTIQSQLRARSAWTQRAPVYRTAPRESARPIPPPILDDRPRPPGMDNLPEGFTWWDDSP